MGIGIDLFLDWENGIWVAGTGIWPLGMGNEVLKNGNGIEVMQVDSQFFCVLSILKYNFDPFLVSLVMIFVVNYIIRSTTCKQAYSGPAILGFLIMCVSECCKCHFRDSNLKIFRAFGTSKPP
jgi:hypothetical protein